MGWKEQAKIYQNDDRVVIQSGKTKFNFEEPQTNPKGDKIYKNKQNASNRFGWKFNPNFRSL